MLLPRPGDIYEHKINHDIVKVLSSDEQGVRFIVVDTGSTFTIDPADFDHDYSFLRAD